MNKPKYVEQAFVIRDEADPEAAVTVHDLKTGEQIGCILAGRKLIWAMSTVDLQESYVIPASAGIDKMIRLVETPGRMLFPVPGD